MPRKTVPVQKPAIQTINRIREQKCFQKRELDLITEHDTIPELVNHAQSNRFDVQHTYLDRYGNDGMPTKTLSESELAQVDRLCYIKFILPTIVEKDEDEYERD